MLIAHRAGSKAGRGGGEVCAASSRAGEWLLKGDCTWPAAAFWALAKAGTSYCVQTAKRGLNATAESCERTLQGGFSSCASCWVLISFSSQGISAARVLQGGKGPPQTGNPVFAMAWAVCPHSVAAARAVWEMHSDLDQHS